MTTPGFLAPECLAAVGRALRHLSVLSFSSRILCSGIYHLQHFRSVAILLFFNACVSGPCANTSTLVEIKHGTCQAKK